MPTLLYTRPTDRVFGTLSVQTGTPAGGYAPTNLDDLAPYRPAKLAETSGAWTRNFPTAQRVDFCAVIHHNLFPGVNVRLQGHSSNTWTAPDVDLPFTVSPAHLDGFTQNLWLSVMDLVPDAALRTRQWWRLAIASPNLQPVAVGEWAVYSVVRNLGMRNISKGSTRTVHRPAIVHETEFMLRRTYDLGTTIRSLNVSLEPTDGVRADVEAWYRSAGGQAQPFVVVPNRLEDEAWFVTFQTPDFLWARANKNHNPLSLQFQEVSRGLPL